MRASNKNFKKYTYFSLIKIIYSAVVLFVEQKLSFLYPCNFQVNNEREKQRVGSFVEVNEA